MNSSDSAKMLTALNALKELPNTPNAGKLRLDSISTVLLKKNFVTHFLYPVYKNVDDTETPTPTTCPTGSYCPLTGTSISIECPAGYYCPAGAKDPTSCPTGKTSVAGSVSCV